MTVDSQPFFDRQHVSFIICSEIETVPKRTADIGPRKQTAARTVSANQAIVLRMFGEQNGVPQTTRT